MGISMESHIANLSYFLLHIDMRVGLLASALLRIEVGLQFACPTKTLFSMTIYYHVGCRILLKSNGFLIYVMCIDLCVYKGSVASRQGGAFNCMWGSARAPRLQNMSS